MRNSQKTEKQIGVVALKRESLTRADQNASQH